MAANISTVLQCLILIVCRVQCQGSSTSVVTTVTTTSDMSTMNTREAIPTTMPTTENVTIPENSTVWNYTTQSPTSAGQAVYSTVNQMSVVIIVDKLYLNEPDDKVVYSGGGQSVEFTVTVSSSNDSASVSGNNNWEIQAFVTSHDKSVHVSPMAQLLLTDIQRTADLHPGGNYTFDNIVVALDLISTVCSDINHFCVVVGPSEQANWTLDVDSEIRKCADISCAGQGSRIIIQTISTVFLPVMLSLLTIL